jgi:protein O-GlcNAc transferase
MNIDEALNRALWLMRQGSLDEAAKACRAILKRERRFFAPYYILGLVTLQRGDAKEAILLFDQALRCKPDRVDVLNDRGVVLDSLGRYEEAIATYDKAVAIKPDFAEAWNNRSSPLLQMGRATEALASVQKAIDVRPTYPDAFNNRGLALHKLKRYDDALESYDAALALRRDYFQAFLNKGNLLAAIYRSEEALRSFDQALSVRPGEPDALLQRGFALSSLNRVDEAAACFQQLLAADPDNGRARIALCMAYLPALYADRMEIPRRRALYAEQLHALAEHVARHSNPGALADDFGDVQPFYLAYQGECDRELQATYGSVAARVMAARFPPIPMPEPPAPDEPVRVGIVSAFFRQHTVWKLMIRGWISQLDRRKFRIFGYYTSAQQDDATRLASERCDRFVQGPLPLDRWREEIKRDAPHVLIFPEIGMDRVPAQLAAQRLAPVQCASWGHPDTTGLPTVDYFLSSDLMEPSGAEDHYTERLIRLPNLSIYYEPMEPTPETVNRAELGLRATSIAYWCAQALPKYLPQFDEIFPRIAREVGDCQFVLVENFGARPLTDFFRRRLEGAFAQFGLSADDHCVWLPRMTMARFIAAIGKCDIVLDSIGWSGGNTTLETLAHALPIVTMPGALMRGRHTLAILDMMEVTETTAESIDDYVSIAARLARTPAWREAIAARMREGRQRIYRDRASVAALEAFLSQVSRSGLST